MDIYLEAILPGGKLMDVGHYRSPSVPRVGERVHLCLDRYGMSHERPHPQDVRFRVTDVLYKANNTTRVEDWMLPWHSDMESETVLLRVAADDNDARDYLARLVAVRDEWPIVQEGHC